MVVYNTPNCIDVYAYIGGTMNPPHRRHLSERHSAGRTHTTNATGLFTALPEALLNDKRRRGKIKVNFEDTGWVTGNGCFYGKAINN